MSDPPAVPTNTVFWELLALDVLVGFIVFIVFGAMLIRAARYEGLAPIIAPLAMLTGLALILGGVTDNTALVALASTGVGALAAALTQTIKPKKTDTPTDEIGQPPSDDLT